MVTLVLAGICCVALIGASGCGASTADDTKSPASGEATSPAGQGMAGSVKKVVIPRATIDAKPTPPVLTSPESAVRSYVEWVSYAYRIAESVAATPVMSPQQEVKVDSYVQFNLQESRRIDQQLESITFGTAKLTSQRAVLPATETWNYRYISISDPAKILGGPYPASYETTYTVVKNDKGDWVVDSVQVKPIGEIK